MRRIEEIDAQFERFLDARFAFILLRTLDTAPVATELPGAKGDIIRADHGHQSLACLTLQQVQVSQPERSQFMTLHLLL